MGKVREIGRKSGLSMGERENGKMGLFFVDGGSKNQEILLPYSLAQPRLDMSHNCTSFIGEALQR